MTKKEVDFKLWSTKVIRFNASTRLYSWAKLIDRLVVIFSIYLIILSVFLFAEKTQSDKKEIANLVNIFFSIIMFSVGLLVNCNIYDKEAKKQHECGRKISRLLNNSKSEGVNTETVINEYDSILDEYENHKEDF